MSRIVILGIRALIVLIAAGALLFQIRAVPFLATELEAATRVPLGVPYAVAGILTVLCVQIALVAIWVLLSMVRKDAIFSDRAFRWVDVIIAVAGLATLLTLAVGVHLYYVVNPILDAPGMVAIAVATTILGAAFVLLMLVMRGLLRSATSMHSELAEVV